MNRNNGSSYNEGVAIIGIGCIYPKAVGKDAFWSNMNNGVDGIIEVPPARWDSGLYYDPDKTAPDKTYSKLGGFTDDIDTKSISIKYKIPPRTVEAMDRAQAYAVIATGEALEDSGYAQKDFNRDRTAVIIGNSMGGDQEDYTNLRIFHPYIDAELNKSAAFSSLDEATRKKVLSEFEGIFKKRLPGVSEDTMPGELSNVIAGRIANTFNLRGQNCTVDAACASSLAAFSEAMKGLRMHDFDMVVCGGSDFMMGPGPYVKFSKIGALSPDGSRPFDAKANGFIMGEGVGIYILKRVSDARRDGDRIYAIVRGIGASSDGKGKGITAPNPKGQVLAIRRAFEAAGYGPETVQLVEAHGTSTSVGDQVEVESLLEVWKSGALASGSIGLGSVKSMIGHLKAAAGSAAIVKVSLALHNKIMPPSINFIDPNPEIQFGKIPFRVITAPEEWPKGANGNPRRASVSAFGFGGTNFHIAMEDDAGTNGMPDDEKKYYSIGHNKAMTDPRQASGARGIDITNNKGEAEGAMKTEMTDVQFALSAGERKRIEAETIVLGGDSLDEVVLKIDELKAFVESKLQGDGYSIRLKDVAAAVNPASKGKNVIAALSVESMDDCLAKLDSARAAIHEPKKWLLLANKGVFFGDNLAAKRRDLGKLALQFPGQGSQYVNMLKDMYNKYRVVKETFDEADAIMKELIGETLTGIMFVPDGANEAEKKEAENKLRRTEITQPAILMVDYALYRLLKTYGIAPHIVIGHSLGEYGALIASGVLSFRDALVSVAARGKEIASIKVDDVGKMASVAADYPVVEEVIKGIDGYVIPANKNCYAQTVIGGNSGPVEQAIDIFAKKGIEAREIPVSHAFHSNIVALACEPYRRVLERLQFNSPAVDIVANINAEYYPKGDGARGKIIDILVKHIASPVEYVRQIERIYADGVRMFVEVGPKKTLTSFAQNIAGKRPHFAVATNHPKRGGVFSFNDALAAMAAYGLDPDWNGVDFEGRHRDSMEWRFRDDFTGGRQAAAGSIPAGSRTHDSGIEKPKPAGLSSAVTGRMEEQFNSGPADTAILASHYQEKQKEIIKEMLEEYSQKSAAIMSRELEDADYYRRMIERYNINFDRIMISGISVGLPGSQYDVFENGFERILKGENMIEQLSKTDMEKMLSNNIIRLVKGDGEAHFEVIDELSKVVKLAGCMGRFDFEHDYGADRDFAESLDITTKLAIAAGVRALRDAGIPLMRFYKDTTVGGILPVHWGLPEEMGEDTGIIFSSAFPGYDNLVNDISKNFAYKYGSKAKSELINLYHSIIERVKDERVREELTDWYAKNYTALQSGSEGNLYQFNRKFIFRMLAMGHAQFAHFIKAKGPNVQVNTACSSTVTAVGMAEDWIRTGRAKRVVVVGGDAATSDMMREWILSAFLAVGAVTTEGDYRNAAIPFDRRRNGMIAGMGAVGLVIETESELKKRGMMGIAELVATEFGNSAYHVTRLDVHHIASVMERLVAKAERIMDVRRGEFAGKTIFMSHETYTPARGGSASAEVESLRTTFGARYKDILVTNTKGFTGHPMGAGIEDAIIVKALQTGNVPPIANYREPDPDLGELNLSKGGIYEERQYGLRLGAGFGSQIGMSFIKLVSREENRVVDRASYEKWLSNVSGLVAPQLEVVNNTLRIKDDIDQVRNNKKRSIEAAKSAMPVEPDPIEAAKVQAIPAKSADEAVYARIRAIVADKTGYPEDMIEFDLDMESDLGIDTVKQAEMFGMIRESFSIPQQEGLKIKDFPTLSHVVQFVKDRAHGLPRQAAAPVKAETHKTAVAPSGGNGADEAIYARIRAIVADKTGYPEDMIEFDLDMESDLGIDTVKQAEMFGMIRESFSIPQQEGLKIKDFPTLSHVVQFVKSKSPDYSKAEAAYASASMHAAGSARATIQDDTIKRMVVEVIDYPIDKNASPAMDFNEMNVLITDDGRGVARSLEKLLVEKKAVVEIIDSAKTSDEEKLLAEIKRIQGHIKCNAIVHLAPIGEPKPLDNMSFDEWRKATFKRVKSLYILAKAFQKDLVENGKAGKAFLVSVTGMGGTFGIENFEDADPIAGGVTGLTKGLNKELAGVVVKSIDVSRGLKPLALAKKIIKEIETGGARVEVGYVGDRRMATQVAHSSLDLQSEPKSTISPDSVFVVTGGGYGITAEIAKDLAMHLNVRLALVSLEKLPDNTAEIARMGEKELSEFKDRVVSGLKAANERITPVAIQKEMSKYTVAAEIYRNIQEMKALGARDVEYYSCDVTDNAMVADVLNKIRERFGAINGIVHGAGLEQSKLMEDKKYEDFCRVFDVKADGAYNFVELTKNDNVRFFVPFASVAGRFGNIGQTDYSSANDLLNKYSQLMNRRFAGRGMRAVSMNWTGWRDVGMATRGSIAKILEEGGVDMIPRAVGVTKVREELLFGGDAEVVIAGNLGEIDCDRIIAGDRSRDFLFAENEIRSSREQYPLIDALVEFTPGRKIAVRKKLDTGVDLYLNDHAIEGVPYFPAVMGIETFSEAARLLFPDKHVQSMKNVEFKYPIKLLKGKPVDITITLEVTGWANGRCDLAAKIESEFFTKNGMKLGNKRLHFVAGMTLSDDFADLPGMGGNGFTRAAIKGYRSEKNITISEKEIYRRFFHGPKFQVHGGVIGMDKDHIVGRIAANGHALFSTVKKPRFIAAPLLIEAALQNAGIYGMVRSNISSLPDAIGEISFKPVPEQAGQLYIWAQRVGTVENRIVYDAQVVDKDGNVYSTLKEYKMITTGELRDDERFQ